MSVTEITRPTSIHSNWVSSGFREGRLNVVVYTANKAKVSILPVTDNPKRKLLYSNSGRNGLRIFYYTDNIERVFIANGHSFVHIERADLYAVHHALRKFTRTARQDLTRKPGRPQKQPAPP